MTVKLQPVDSSSVFNTSLRYTSIAETLRSQLFKKAIAIVNQWDMDRPTWKLSKEAKELANTIFKEYSETLQADFSQPNYSFWLENSINAQKPIFISDFLEQINSKIPDNV